MQLSEVVEEHTSLIPVINRFGIRLGLGDKSVKDICSEHQIDLDFLLVVINTFLNEEYFPEKRLQTFHTSQIIDYLTKTNSDYQRHQLPNIERHLGSFISLSAASGNNSLAVIGKFFASFKAKLTDRIEKDTNEWFPYCLSLSEKLGKLQTDKQEAFILNLPEHKIDNSLEALLTDLKSLMIKHISGEYNENLCYAVIFAISSLEKDIRQQDRIRFRILAPMVSAMEKLSL
ncbi:helix-turn-helix transcriptional regulator [Massilibacteroides sp.]|uniref:helix-turn-helix transcriptional regulator n=1 Tax=Massilibacteroides sp. TaxID=2034766 RepID=UPI002616717C|nr:helix-turn-helix transcriptional regulator [Massilibacteroides sp.]MDD4515005.1 helix-turn-helix transcriptional regulator [Massilibacteroides sp.]